MLFNIIFIYYNQLFSSLTVFKYVKKPSKLTVFSQKNCNYKVIMVNHHHLFQFQGCVVILDGTFQGHLSILIIMKSNCIGSIYISPDEPINIVNFCSVPTFLKAFSCMFISRVMLWQSYARAILMYCIYLHLRRIRSLRNNMQCELCGEIFSHFKF